VVACYPGLYAIAIYRAAQPFALREGAQLVPRMMTEYAPLAHWHRTSTPVPALARLLLDHGTGIVIGETTRIGRAVASTGVTLGALSIKRKVSAARGDDDAQAAGAPRHPTIETTCVIYANATILGGRLRVDRQGLRGGATPGSATQCRSSQASTRGPLRLEISRIGRGRTAVIALGNSAIFLSEGLEGPPAGRH